MILSPCVQTAYFVNNCEASAKRMARLVGAGPFFLIEKIQLSKSRYRGEDHKFVHSSAFGQWGNQMVEFVQQDCEGPSPFRDMFGQGQEGLHHLACFVPSLDEACAHYERLETPIVSRSTTLAGQEFAFIDATSSLGHMIEIYEPTKRLEDFYKMVREAAVDWRGDDPVRQI